MLMREDLKPGSAYSAGAPTYESAALQRSGIEGRLKVAQGIVNRAIRDGDHATAARWRVIVDELFERLNEVRGR